MYKGLSSFGWSKHADSHRSKQMNFSSDQTFGRPTKRDNESMDQVISYQYEKEYHDKLEHDRIAEAIYE